jgi:hypothetical protein
MIHSGQNRFLTRLPQDVNTIGIDNGRCHGETVISMMAIGGEVVSLAP